MIFFLFTGTLAFGLGPMGIAAGCLTVAIIIFNIYVLRTNKSYSDQTDKEQQEMVTRVANQRPAVPSTSPTPVQPGSDKDANPFTVDVNMGIGGHNMTVPVLVSAADVTSAAVHVAKSNTIGNTDWEKIYDKGSGKYYFYNAKTQESRWELDS